MPKFGTARLPAAPSHDPADEPEAAPSTGAARVTELKVGGHLMVLESGLFCVFHAPGSSMAEAATGLPGVRISVAPGHLGRADQIQISTFRNDGWLTGNDDAALIRVTDGPAQILVTVYQSPQSIDAAPRLQVLQLSGSSAAAPAAPRPGLVAVPTPAARDGEIVAHVQRTGDTTARLGDWIGNRGSKRWVEGFGVAPSNGVAAEDIEYQAVLGRGWLSPWVKGGEFCGSRGMALPILGLRVRLTGAAAAAFVCTYAATFVDGSSAGPVAEGEACEADGLAPLEAFQIILSPRPVRAARMPAEHVRKDPPKSAARSPAPPSLRGGKLAQQAGKTLPGGRTR